MLLYLLLGLTTFICASSYILTKRDLFSPPVVFSGVFVISILVAIPNMKLWAFDMGERTFIVLLLGICFFCVGFFLIFFGRQSFNKKLVPVALSTNSIQLKSYKFGIILFIQLITIYFFYHDILTITTAMGAGNSFAEKIYYYRLSVITIDDNYGTLSSLTSNLLLFCQVMNYFLMYKFCNDFFVEKKLNKKILLLIFINLIMQLLNGARGPLVDYLVSFSCMMYIFWRFKNHWKKPLSIKKVMIIVIALIIFLLLFSSIGLILVGREEQLKGGDMLLAVWEQISVYIGASLKLLDLYMYTDYTAGGSGIGAETFQSVYDFLSRYSLISYESNGFYSRDFRIDNGQSLGNVYTVFLPFVADFGYGGVVILSLIEGMIYAYVYFSMKYKRVVNKFNYNIILYSFLFIPLFRVFCQDFFYRNIFSMNFIKMIILYKIIEYIFFSKKYIKV